MSTKNDREEILNKVLRTIAENEELKEHEVTMEEVPCTGINYTAAIYLITLRDKEKGQLALFAKVAMANETERYVMQIEEMYKREAFIYLDMTKIFNDLQDRHWLQPENRYLFPKFYASILRRFEETLVIENLCVRGYETTDRFKSLNWDLASKIVSELAKFHAMSMAFESENPNLFAEMVKTKGEYVFTRSGFCVDAITKYTKDRINMAMECLAPENVDKFKKFIRKIDPNIGHSNQFKLQSRPCLVHGDFKQGNVLVKMENGVLQDLIIVDYQCVHYGSPVNDLMYLVFTGSDEAFRTKHFKKLLEHYYSSLSETLLQFKLNVDTLYPKKSFDRDVEERSIYGIYLGIFVLPYTLAEKKPDFGQDTSDINVSSSKLYKERFNGIINDFVKWGYL